MTVYLKAEQRTCPKCGAELARDPGGFVIDTNPQMVYVSCPKCGFSGLRDVG